MLTIRLQRAGKRNKAEYRVVLAEKTAASQKKFTEVLGSYNPHTKALAIRNADRLNYWIKEQHVEISPTVHNLFLTNNLIEGAKKKAFSLPKKEKPKAEAEKPTESSEASEVPSAKATETPAEVPAADAPAPSEVPVETPAEEPKAE